MKFLTEDLVVDDIIKGYAPLNNYAIIKIVLPLDNSGRRHSMFDAVYARVYHSCPTPYNLIGDVHTFLDLNILEDVYFVVSDDEPQEKKGITEQEILFREYSRAPVIMSSNNPEYDGQVGFLQFMPTTDGNYGSDKIISDIDSYVKLYTIDKVTLKETVIPSDQIYHVRYLNPSSEEAENIVVPPYKDAFCIYTYDQPFTGETTVSGMIPWSGLDTPGKIYIAIYDPRNYTIQRILTVSPEEFYKNGKIVDRAEAGEYDTNVFNAADDYESGGYYLKYPDPDTLFEYTPEEALKICDRTGQWDSSTSSYDIPESEEEIDDAYYHRYCELLMKKNNLNYDLFATVSTWGNKVHTMSNNFGFKEVWTSISQFEPIPTMDSIKEYVEQQDIKKADVKKFAARRDAYQQEEEEEENEVYN